MRAKVKDINFLPRRIVLARKKRKNTFFYSLLGVMACMLIFLMVWYPYHIAMEYQGKLAGVNQKLEELEPAKPVYEKMATLQKDLEEKEQALTYINEQRLKITEVLQVINTILPQECFVSALSIKAKEDFNIQIVTHSPVETAKVLVKLRETGLFEKVSLSESGEIPFVKGAQPVEFKLKFTGADAANDAEQ